MTAAPLAARPRNFGLDLLRLAAIGGVLALHGYFGFFLNTGQVAWGGTGAALSAIAAMFSLDWFFVLSGFLIGSMMIRSFDADPRWWVGARDFWLRRWFRTVPNYYLFLLLHVALAAWGVTQGQFRGSFAVFSQNLAWPEQQPLFFAEAWSLALEEWFYVLMPLLLGVLAWLPGLQRRDRFWLVAALLILTPTLLRMLAAPSTDFFDWDARVRRITVMHLDSAGWGVVAAIVNRWHPGWWRLGQGVGALAGVLLMALATAAMWHFMQVDWQAFGAAGRFNDLARITAPALGTALTLPWLAGRATAPAPVRRLAGRLADYVYSAYLCHYPLTILVWRAAQAPEGGPAWPVWLLIAAWLLAVLAVSALVFHAFERPVASLRDRWTRRVPAGPFQAAPTGDRSP